LLIQDRDACGGILRKGQKSWKALVEVYSNWVSTDKILTIMFGHRNFQN
jgi:hypothetical protein